MSEHDQSVILTFEGGIARIQLNRPASLNAINVEMAVALRDALLAVQRQAGVRVLHVHGAGRGFMAGGDLASLKSDSAVRARALINPLHEAIGLLSELEIPVVAQLHGVVAGAGISIALACDFILAGQTTRFNFAYCGIGASPDASGSWHLPRIVGLHKAIELLMLSEPFDAEEALRLGLVGQVIADDALVVQTEALIKRLAAAPTVALGQTRRLLRQALQNDLRTHLNAECEAFCACAGSRDFALGVEAFFQRQPARFTGS